MGQANLSRVKSLLEQRFSVAKMIVRERAVVTLGRPAHPVLAGLVDLALLEGILTGEVFFDIAIARAAALGIIEGPACKACGGVGGSEEADDCDACAGSGRARDPHSEGRRRGARRLLDALEGQPSECPGLDAGEYDELSEFVIINDARSRAVPCVGGWLDPSVIFAAARRCPRCQGTGHNLRGTLPALEWSPAVRRKARDAVAAHDFRKSPFQRGWLGIVLDGELDSDWALSRWLSRDEKAVRDARTRVCPRGEHRDCWQRVHSDPRDPTKDRDLDRRVEARMRYDLITDRKRHAKPPPGVCTWSWDHATSRLPRWRRGELARQLRSMLAAAKAVDGRRHVAQDREPDHHRCSPDQTQT